MTNREKLLTGAVAAVGVLWFGTQGLQKYRVALDANQRRQIEAEEALSDAKVAEARGLHAHAQLNKWIEQSLPADREVAESLYQDWLRSQLTGAGLEVTQLSDRSAAGRHPQYTELSLEYRGSGTLEQLADFLFRFYTAPHLHRISAATLTGAEGGKKLTLTMTVNALILPDVKRKDSLASGEPKNIGASLDEFRQRLKSRDMFVAYTPKSGGNSAESQDQAAAKTVLTSTTYTNEGWMMWTRNEESGEVKHYVTGDSIEVGKVKGKIVEIERRRAVIETDKGRLEISWGQKFSDAVPLAAPAAQLPGAGEPRATETVSAESGQSTGGCRRALLLASLPTAVTRE
jgi:hypothetical protein